MESFTEFLNYVTVFFFNFVGKEEYIQAFLLLLFLMGAIILSTLVCIITIYNIILFITELYKVFVRPLFRRV